VLEADARSPSGHHRPLRRRTIRHATAEGKELHRPRQRRKHSSNWESFWDTLSLGGVLGWLSFGIFPFLRLALFLVYGI